MLCLPRCFVMQDKPKFHLFIQLTSSIEMSGVQTPGTALLRLPFFQFSVLKVAAHTVESWRFLCKKYDNCRGLWQNYICKSNAPFLRTPASLPSLTVLPPWRQDHKRTPITRECTLQPNWTLTTAWGSSWTTGEEELLMKGVSSWPTRQSMNPTLHFFLSLSLSHFSYACVVQQLLRRRKCQAYKKEGGGDECARRMF